MNCSSILFSMEADIFYPSTEQDKYGAEQKTWMYDQTLKGYFEILGAVDKDALKTGKFYEYQDKLIGRTKSDPRESSEGFYYAITDILVSRIKDIKTKKEYYIESVGERESLSTVYEVFAIEPYVNPWNKVEYYKIFLNRSDTQVLMNNDQY